MSASAKRPDTQTGPVGAHGGAMRWTHTPPRLFESDTVSGYEHAVPIAAWIASKTHPGLMAWANSSPRRH